MFEIFYLRGQQLSYARKVMDGEPKTISALALVSIHSAIAYNDALHIRLTGKRPKGDDHKTAAISTEKSCRVRKLNTAGIVHLKTLIEKKTAYSYGNSAVTSEQAQAVSIKAERFEAWVNQIIKELE